jgi:N-acyl-D-aspartate/D-glutamate deacylase
MHDLTIHDATLYDGSGAPPVHADIAVHEGVITAVGPGLAPGREAVRADGLALMPGIIDTHTHYDAQITWDPALSPSPSLGVTTVVMGNCGFTIAPCRPEHRGLTMRNLTHVEGMPLLALENGIAWDFETFPEYLDALERRGTVPNVAAFVGHSSVRTWVMGEQATRRAATEGEVAQMRSLVAGAMVAGAVGFSTTASPQHNGEHGVPMPSRLADASELEALADTLRGSHGRLMITKGFETPMSFLESLSARSGRPFIVAALLHSAATPESVFEDMAAIRAASARGNRMYGAVSACPLTFEFTMAAPYVFEGLQAWQPAMQAHDQADYLALLRSAALRDALDRELSVRARRLFNGEWQRMFVLKARDAANTRFEGRSVADCAREAGVRPFDWLLDLALSEDLATEFFATLLNADEVAVGRLLCDPDALVSLSDAGAHLEFLCDAGFGLHLLGHWSRELGVLPLERAVRRLTADAASAFGMGNRGRIAPGMAADLLLFDPATVGRGPARRCADLPGGASRLVTPGKGVHGVWVNGTPVVNAQGLCEAGKRPGRLLRRFDA